MFQSVLEGTRAPVVCNLDQPVGGTHPVLVDEGDKVIAVIVVQYDLGVIRKKVDL